jgi:hypothetical protein
MPIEELSICFFLHEWINKVTNTIQGDILTNTVSGITPIILRDHSSDLLLRHTVNCLGKASIAVNYGSPTTKMAAETDYVIALRLINRALNDVVAAKSNQTLIAVMLLGIYEVKPAREIYLTVLHTKPSVAQYLPRTRIIPVLDQTCKWHFCTTTATRDSAV